VSIADNDDWNADSALLSCPTEEISVVSDCVCSLISASCGAAVAATSCETNEETLITEPPAAPALVLLATETGEVEELDMSWRSYRGSDPKAL
jgi:hypothetical protein